MELKSIPRLELIQVAEAVSREKSIEKEEVIFAMEEAPEDPVATIAFSCNVHRFSFVFCMY